MSSIIIKNATIINEGKKVSGSLLINNGIIERIATSDEDLGKAETYIDAKGQYLLPGVIDDQVHFREPGLTHKGDIYSESKAAIAGGVTSYMEMPNTIPQTTTIEELEKKHTIASRSSLANYSFYFGATNDNLAELIKIDPTRTCGVKVFMGSSTGNMLVDNKESLAKIFKHSPTLIATHCEDEATIRQNLQIYQSKYGDSIPMECHAMIRSEEACYKSSSVAVELAKKNNARLHLLHLSTARELDLLDAGKDLSKKSITGEVCVHHLWFNSNDYQRLGWRIKWNPSVKSEDDRVSLLRGLIENRLDVIATDHAPHTKGEKENSYLKCPSGGPMVQHSLTTMLEMTSRGQIPIETVVDKMCHAPARLFRISKRGFIREGYHADLVIVAPDSPWEVSQENIHYKCKWSPLEGESFQWKVTNTLVNGRLVYNNGNFDEIIKGSELIFRPEQ